MAKRLCFISKPDEYPVYNEVEIEFEYYTGFAVTQKQKSINSLHKRIRIYDSTLNVLEISSKSNNPLGIALSAFNLQFYVKNLQKEFPIENVFQSSKVFQNGGPYKDLLYVHPKDAKRDMRIKESGELQHFYHDDKVWELEPKTMFYDWIYIIALYNNKSLSKKILEYNAFTDIEFNQKKSVNCQARSAAIFVSLCIKGILEETIEDKASFRKIYDVHNIDDHQMTLFND